MKIGDLCVRAVAVASADEDVVTAARRMADSGVGDLVVIEERDGRRRPVGIVTDRDLVVRSLVRGEPLGSRIGDVIGDALVTAREDEEVEDVLARMRNQGVRRIPIVDEQGYLAGIVSLDDIVVWLCERMADVVGLLARQQTDA